MDHLNRFKSEYVFPFTNAYLKDVFSRLTE